MQQLNFYGCRDYLQSVALNQSTQLPSTVITRVPFKFSKIQFRSREPNTLRSICTTSESLCMMAPFTYSSVHLQNKQLISSPKNFLRRPSAISNHFWGLLIMLSKHEQRQDSTILFYSSFSPCLREDFPKWVLHISLFHMDMQYVKCD